MVLKRYPIQWAKIGNSRGFRLGAEFFKDNPHLVGAEGAVEVLDNGQILMHLCSEEIEQQEDELMLSLFLDFVMKQSLADPSHRLEAYTEAMAAEDDELLAGVVIDADS